MKYKQRSKRGSPLIWSITLGMGVCLGTMVLGAYLLAQGAVPESFMPYIGGISLFLTASFGGWPLTANASKKMVTALLYSLGWILLLLALHLGCWHTGESFQWWPILPLLAGGLVAAVISSRPKKLAY